MVPISDRYLEDDGEFIVPGFCSIPLSNSFDRHDRTLMGLALRLWVDSGRPGGNRSLDKFCCRAEYLHK
jgi:hypothetical protein